MFSPATTSIITIAGWIVHLMTLLIGYMITFDLNSFPYLFIIFYSISGILFHLSFVLSNPIRILFNLTPPIDKILVRQGHYEMVLCLFITSFCLLFYFLYHVKRKYLLNILIGLIAIGLSITGWYSIHHTVYRNSIFIQSMPVPYIVLNMVLFIFNVRDYLQQPKQKTN